MKYILAIDQGTTSTRSIIYDRQGKAVSTAANDITQYYPAPGWVEHDANEIWLKTQGAIANSLINGEISPSDICGIGITNQRETTVIWDKETGIPVHNAIVWQSRQTMDICQDLIDQGYQQLVKEKTGLKIDPYFSATKIRFILDTDSELQRRAEAGELLFGTIDSWLIWKLTTGKVHLTDVTNASRTMLYNIYDLSWDQQLLDILNIPAAILPQVVDSSGILGYTAKEHFFGQEIAIAGVAGDQHAALFGQQSIVPGMVKNTYGTGCFMLMNTGSNAKSSANGLLTTIGWSLNGEVTYALEGSVFVGGSSIQWLRDELSLIDDAKETESLALSCQTNNVYVVPAFVGLGTPYWDANARGAIFGLTRDSGIKEITKATLQSICYQSRDVLEVMLKDSGLPITQIKVDGGAVVNDYLMQFQADITDVEVIRPTDTETTALGAGFLAGLGVGFWTMDDLAKINECNQVFTANISLEERDELYAGWKKAVAATQIFK